MGYQESYLRMKKSEDFDSLVDAIEKSGKESFHIAEPVEKITLLQPIKGDLSMQCKPEKQYSFDKGEKFVYVSGDRGSQRSPEGFFGQNPNQKVPRKMIDELEIYFTECFPSEDIFTNSKVAKHEQFWR